MLDSLAPARRRVVLAALGLVVLVVVVAVVASLLSRPPAVEPVSQATPGPVLLVPGYGGSTTSLDVLAQALRDAGRDATVVGPPGDGRGDLREQARNLATAVDAALDRTGADSVDVVGYSAGGVVVRWWAAELGGAGQARRILTLASPHHGTELAGLAADLGSEACAEACQQLTTDSDLLRDLNGGDETPDGPLWVALWTTDDTTVVPPDSGSLDGAVDFSVQSVCPDVTVAHPDVPRDPTVVAMVLAELGTAEPSVPGPDVCAAR